MSCISNDDINHFNRKKVEKIIHCQAQPQLNSTQPQLKLRLRLALFPVSDKPPTRKSSGKIQLNPFEYFKSLKSALEYYSDNSNCMTIINETVVHFKFGPFTHCISDFNSTLKVAMW